MRTVDAERLGLKLRAIRLAQRRTQGFIARRTGLSRETINRIEHGRVCYPATLERIARALDLKLTKFFPDGIPLRAFSQLQAGNEFRLRRQRLGLPLKACAAAAGVSASTISRFERALGWQRQSALGHPLLQNDGFARVLGFESLAALQCFSVCGRDRCDDYDDDWEDAKDD